MVLLTSLFFIGCGTVPRKEFDVYKKELNAWRDWQNSQRSGMAKFIVSFYDAQNAKNKAMRAELDGSLRGRNYLEHQLLVKRIDDVDVKSRIDIFLLTRVLRRHGIKVDLVKEMALLEKEQMKKNLKEPSLKAKK
jgi:hypothetical protein